MPLRFGFDASFLTTASTLERGNMFPGSYQELDYPSYASAVAPNQSIATSGGVDVFAMTLIQGETYKFDIDNGSIDLELDIIDQAGKRVGGNDDFNGGRDPFLSFTAARRGPTSSPSVTPPNDYLDGFFDWERTPTPTGPTASRSRRRPCRDTPTTFRMHRSRSATRTPRTPCARTAATT
jgi:hypothetical protein